MLVLAGPQDQPAPFVESMKTRDIDCEVISMRGDLDPLLVLRVLKFIRGHASQLVHTHLIHADLYGTLAARLAGIPTVVSTKHGYNPWRTHRLYAFLDRLAALLQDRIITISDALGRWLVEVEGLPQEKLSTIHYALDVDRFRPSTAGDLSLKASRPVIGTISRLIHQKGIHVLLQAFAVCAKNHPTSSLVVVGEGPERSNLEDLAEKLGLGHRVHFLGYRSDVDQILPHMDIFTLPSFGEGFGLVLLEAMACSKPVVATNVMSIPEIINQGETGFLVPVQDSPALAKALDTLIDNPEMRDQFGKAGFRRVQEDFTIEGMVGKTIKEYQEATETSRGKRKSGSPLVRNPALSPEQRTKIVRIIARLNIGGPSLHVVNLNKGLSSDRFESLLVIGSPNPGEGSMLDYAQENGVQPLTIPEMVGEASLRPRDLKALWMLYRILQAERPHIVHTHTAKAGFLGRLAARMAGVPIIVHTYHGHVLNGYYGPVKSWLLTMMERGLARITDRLVAVSELVKQDLITYGVAPPEKISVIPLGFDLEPFFDCESLKGEFRRELELGPGDKLVGILGRIFPIKNHRLFLESAAQIAQQESNVHFVIVGDGVLRSEMEKYAQDLRIDQRVFFTGWRRDLPRIYADLDLLVVSSNNEGTPVSAIEAMASGCPVVATRVGGLPDVVQDRETGYLVPPKQPEALTAAMLILIRDSKKAEQMGRSAQLSVEMRFSLDRLLRDTENLYQELLTSKRLS